MSLARSELSGLINAARNKGHNTEVGKGVWSLHAKVPQKPYDPMVFSKDVYPRNPVTMMPVHKNAPKYYDGKFLTYDYKDMVPLNKSGNSGGPDRPVVFKPDHIQNVQTKKKYVTLKGKSSVPLHLINDVTSELFQRSLNINEQYDPPDDDMFLFRTDKNQDSPTPRDRGHINSGLMQSSKASDISTTKMLDDSMSDVSSSRTTQSSKMFGVKDQKVSLNDRELRSGQIYAEPDWLKSEILRDKVANTMKFMGKASYYKTPRRREYDINFG